MATKSKRSGGGARSFAVDRNEGIDRMVKDLQGSKERSVAFMANPVQVAKDYGVRLSKEEEYAIKFVNGFSLISSLGKFRSPGAAAVFNNNCGCGGSLTDKINPARG